MPDCSTVDTPTDDRDLLLGITRRKVFPGREFDRMELLWRTANHVRNRQPLPHRVRCARSNWFSIEKSVVIPNLLSPRDIFLFSFRLFHADCFIRNMVHEFARI
jgi:hypothetical protein